MADDQAKTMQPGDDPGDFTNDQVNAYLASLGTEHDDDVERERVLDQERGGQARVGIVGPAEEQPEPTPEPEASYDDVVEREDVGTTDAFIIPNHNTVSQDVQVEAAAAANAELVEAGVNQAQGFIGSDATSTLLG